MTALQSPIPGRFNAGANEYLTKPLDLRRFLTVLDQHLGQTHPPTHSEPDQ